MNKGERFDFGTASLNDKRPTVALLLLSTFHFIQIACQPQQQARKVAAVPGIKPSPQKCPFSPRNKSNAILRTRWPAFLKVLGVYLVKEKSKGYLYLKMLWYHNIIFLIYVLLIHIYYDLGNNQVHL